MQRRSDLPTRLAAIEGLEQRNQGLASFALSEPPEDGVEGLMVVFLNLDEVIRIIREEDDAKGELIRAFKLGDVQADAVLNMRLRHLRKLEEMEIRTEHDTLTIHDDPPITPGHRIIRTPRASNMNPE